jgi:hypothetical protein
MYNYYYLDFKQNISKNENISLIIFCNDISKKNHPTINFIRTINSIITSSSVQNCLKINSCKLIIFLARWIFKLYIFFLRLYINNEFIKIIEFVDSFEVLNEDFYFDLSESYLKLKNSSG